MSSKKQQQIDWRRERVFDFYARAHTQSEIADILHVNRCIVCRDMAYIKKQAKFHLKSYIEEKLPSEFEASNVGLTAILKEAWNVAQTTEDNREKIQALSLCKDVYSSRVDLLTNMNVIDDVIKFVGNRKYKQGEEEQEQEQGNEEQKEGQVQEQEQQQGEDYSTTVTDEAHIQICLYTEGFTRASFET